MFIFYHLTLSCTASKLIIINNKIALKDKKCKNIVVIVKLISKYQKRRDLIFEIESCKKFNIKIIKNVEEFRRKIYATYLI